MAGTADVPALPRRSAVDDPRRPAPRHPRHRHRHDAGRHRHRHARRASPTACRRGPPATATARRCCPSIGRFLGEQNIRRSRLAGIVVGTGPGAFTGLRVGHRHGQGAGPRAGHPARRRLDRGGAARRRSRRSRPNAASCSCRPARRDRIVVRPGAPPVLAARRARSRTSPPDERLVAVDLEGRAPDDAVARGETARAGLGQALLARRRRPSRDARAARRRPDRARHARARLRDAPARRPRRRAGPSHGRATPGEGGHRADAARRPPRRPRDRAGELHLALAAARLPERARDEPARALPRRAGRRTQSSAYGGMWLMVDEAHITTFAVHPGLAPPAHRRAAARSRSSTSPSTATPTRRRSRSACPTSPPARLYEKYGFRPVGLRPRYYSDDNEDALIMTTEPLAEPAMRDRIARLRAALDAAPAPTDPAERRPRPARGRRVSGPLLLVDRVLLRRDRHRPRRGRPADPLERRRLPGRAARPDGRHRARGRRAGPPALDRAGARRGVGRRRRGAGTTSTASPSRTARASPARCWSGSTSPRRSPGSTTCRSSASTTSRATSTPAGCSIRARTRRAARAGLPARRARRERRPHVPRRDARPPDLPAARHDRRRRRGRGVRQGRSAARPGYPGGPAIQKAAEGAVRRDVRVPAGVDGRLVRLQLLGPQDRRAADRRRGPRRRGPAGRRPGGAACPRPTVAELAWGFQDVGRRRARHEDGSGPREAIGARSIVLGGGVAANSVLRERLARRGGRRSACRSSSRDPGCARTTGR